MMLTKNFFATSSYIYIILSYMYMMYQKWHYFCEMQILITPKSFEELFLFSFSARYFIMKCNNQRNLDISMAKVIAMRNLIYL